MENYRKTLKEWSSKPNLDSGVVTCGEGISTPQRPSKDGSLFN